jgi:glycosyltransferase involved in cell wall biosynthesis
VTPLWSILIATLSAREDQLAALLAVLLPQCEADGRVEVVGLHNDGEHPLAVYRQALLDAAAGDYVSFVDDDDQVDGEFVPAVTAAMAADPDYVAFSHAYYADGRRHPLPVVTGISYGGWYDTAEALIRDVTQINPVRRSIAQQADFTSPSEGAEDWSYVKQIRPLLRTQADTGRLLYHYYWNSQDTNQRRLAPPGRRPRPVISSPCFRWIEEPA